MSHQIFVHYDEVALKKRSRERFEQKLRVNVSRLLSVTKNHTRRIRGRCVVTLPDGYDLDEALTILSRCFGIARLSVVHQCDPNMDAITASALAEARQRADEGAQSFKVDARRSHKKFPLKSTAINAEIGKLVLEQNPSLRVDVHNPDFVLGVEIFKHEAYTYSRALKGPGGLPTGINGKALLLLSGGIDSPVAGHLCQKRGLHVDACYFHSFPFTGDKTKEKVKDIASVLARSSPDPLRLAIPSVTHIQKALQQSIPQSYWTVMLRRFMLRIADRIAAEFNFGALITGDAIGQVASQTLENLNCLEGVASRLVLRPLAGFDKNEVIAIAREMGSYDLSIQPYPDCCTLFAPRSPVIRGRRELCEKLDNEIDVEALVVESLASTELYRYHYKEGMVLSKRGSQGMLNKESSRAAVTESPEPASEASIETSPHQVDSK